MDQTKSNFYESQIFEAIETIALGITSKMQFDKTVICTITDNKNKDKGEYEVNDGSITFKAYSEDTGYSKDTVVYVLIPQGDYENQKTIIGRYVDDSDSAVKYIPSSDSIIPIKIFESPKDEEYGLLANGTSELEDKSKSIIEIEFTDFDLLKDNTHIYDCVSIQGDFRTDLNSFDIIEGDYGLVLVLSGYYYNDEGKMITLEEPIKYIFNSSEMYGNPYKYNIPFTQDIVFDLNEDLKNIKITSMALYFYQNDNFKELQTKELIPYKTPVLEDSVGLGGIEDISVLYPNNLFVKNIKVQFGYSLSSVKEESVKLYTPNNEKYRDSKDTKELLLKWFKKNEESGKVAYSVIDQDEELTESDRKNTSIFWYRYAIDSKKTSEELITGDEEEPILGKQGFYWELKKIYNNFKYNTIKKYQFKYVNEEKTEVSYVYGEYDKEFKNPLTYDTIDYELEQSDEGKYTVFYSTKDSSILSDEAQKKMHEHLFLATDETPKTERYNIVLKTSSIYAPSPTVEEITNLDSKDSSIFNMQFSPSEYLIREKIKAVLRKNSFEETSQAITGGDEEEDFYIIFKDSTEQIETNELIFENVNSAELDLSSVELIRNMQLNCLDDSNGIYLIYNEINNQILEPKADNCIQVKFDNYCSVDIPRKEEKCKITWKIPFSSTMIQTVDFTLPYEAQTFEDGNTYYVLGTSGKEDSNSEITWQEDVVNNCYYCEYYWTIGEETTDKAYLNQTLMAHYALKPTFIRGGDNRIICEIEKYGNKYTKEINMVFGAAGTAGTSYTLVIELEKEYGNGDTPNLNNPTSKSYVQYLTKETTVDVASNWVKAIATLYNEKNQVVQPKGISWDWHNDKVGIVGYTSKDNSTIPQNEIYIRVDGDSNVGYYGILKASAIVSWLDDDTTLNSYKPLGVVLKDANIAQYVGTEKIIYDAAGKKPSDTEYQRIHQVKNNEGQVKEDIKWNIAAIDTGYNEITDAVYRSYMPTFVYEEYIVETITNNGVEETMIVGSEKVRNNILTLKPLYFKEIEDLNLVIQAKDKNSKVVYSQSLFYGQNAYDIQMLNVWGGEQIIDAEGNRILSALIGAGIKEGDNTFSGVFLGDIERVGADKKTGLLGFNQGIHTFGFHTDGTAFIGQSGGGRIEFDGKEGTITSGNYEESKMGTKIDLDDGSIELNSSNSIKILKSDYDEYLEEQEEEKQKDSYENELNYIVDEQPARQIILNTSASANKGEPVFEVSSYRFQRMDDGSLEVDEEDYIATEKVPLIHIGEKEYYLQSYNFKETEKISDGPTTTIIPGKGVKIDLENNLIKAYNFIFEAGYDDTDSGEGINKSIYISTEDEDTPLKIGNNFSVSWNGQLNAIDGIFSGKITAKSGTIGNWTIEKNALYYGGNAKLEETEEEEENLDGLNSVIEFKIQDGAAIFSPTGVKVTGTAFDVTDWEEEPDSNGKYTGTTSSKAAFENVVLAVGTNFVLTNDGKLYINNAQIGGYAHKNDLSNTSKELQSIITQLGEDLTDDFNTNIGKVNLKAEGSISYLGELNDNAIFLTEAYAGSSDFNGTIVLYEGYMSDDNKYFYEKILKYETPSFVMSSGKYYQDLLTNKYYLYNQDNKLVEIDSLPIDIEINKGYYNAKTEAFYPTISYAQSIDPKTPESHTSDKHYYYFDIDNNQLYQYDSTNSKYILTDPDKVYLFSVSSKGLLQAQNAVISGTIFANAGHIGGWNIQRIQNDLSVDIDGKDYVGSLTYGNTDENDGSSEETAWVINTTDANLTPGAGLWIANDTLFGKTGDKPNAKTCILNIGKNFAVDTDGKLYANGADLVGYASNESVEKFGEDIEAFKDDVNNNISGLEISINEKIQYWTDKYGTIVKYKEEGGDTYFLTGFPEGMTDYKVIDHIDISSNKIYETPEDTKGSSPVKGTMYRLAANSLYFYNGSNFILKDLEKDFKYFTVPSEKLLYANNAVISGTIYATQGWFTGGVSASEGDIGGWKIKPGYLIHQVAESDSLKIKIGNMIDESLIFQIPQKEIIKKVPSTNIIPNYRFLSCYSTYNYDIVYAHGKGFSGQITTSNSYLNDKFEGYTFVSVEACVCDTDKNILGFLNTSDWKVEMIKTSSTYFYFKITIPEDSRFKQLTSDIEDEWERVLQINSAETSNYAQIIINLYYQKGDRHQIIQYQFIDMDEDTDEDTGRIHDITNDKIYNNLGAFLIAHNYNDEIERGIIASKILANAAMSITKGIKMYDSSGDNALFLFSQNQSIVWSVDGVDKYKFSIPTINNDNKSLNFFVGADKNFSVDENGNFIFKDFKDDFQRFSVGGFKLNGPTASDLFWNNSLFTNNTYYHTDTTDAVKKISHYVGFMRAIGNESKSLSNVFLGCKQISKTVNNVSDMPNEFPSPDDWSNNSKYNFYIRFDGKIYTRSNLSVDGKIYAKNDLIVSGSVSTKKDLMIQKGSLIVNSHDISVDNYVGSIVIQGTNNFLAMDSNTIALPRTDEGYVNLYVAANGILPGFPPSEEDDGTKTYHPVSGAKLGNSNYPWATINGKTLTVETASNISDARLKDIQYTVTKNQLLSIYNNLNPVAYKYKNLSQNENHSRTHYGFLAQEVEKIIENVGLTSEDFAAVQIENLEEPIPGCEDGKKYSLNYNEFHGLHVLKNKEQDNRIQELEDRVQELEKQILELRGKGV